ncbi:hypothetical protein ACQWTT_001323 [Acinetobacter baumannii]
MNKFGIYLCGLICSFSLAYFPTEQVKAENSQQTALTAEQRIRNLHNDLKISSLSGREKAHNYVLSEVNKKLDALKTPEEKFTFLMAMNHVFLEGFHVNYNAFVHLNEEDKAFFDGYYTTMLVQLDKDIKEGKKNKTDLIEEYERKFPFKVFSQDLEKIQTAKS